MAKNKERKKLGHINPGKVPEHSSKINPSQEAIQDRKIAFSFKHLDIKYKKFQVSHRKGKYLTTILERFKDLSGMSVNQIFCSTDSKSLRAHKINWNQTSEKKGFLHLNQQLRDLQAYQFQLTSNKHGRVHGFLLDHIFFVVWMDPDHNLYC